MADNTEQLKNSKIIIGGKVLIDLTSDTITPEVVLVGYTGHGANGQLVDGACTFDADTQDATASGTEILTGKTAYVRGKKVPGTMPNNGSVSGQIATKEEQYTVPHGYHDGSGKVGISPVEQAKLIPSNIRKGVSVLGVLGTMDSTEGVKPQSKTVIPSTVEQTILPDEGYNYLSQVVVEAIPYKETVNAAGGITVTIG